MPHTVTPAPRHSTGDPSQPASAEANNSPTTPIARGWSAATYLVTHAVEAPRNSVPPPPSLFTPTTPTYSEDAQEAAEAAEVQRALFQLTPERLKDLELAHDRMPLDAEGGRDEDNNGPNNRNGYERPRTPFPVLDAGISPLMPEERVRRMSEWFAGVSPEDGVPQSERSFAGSQEGSAVASLTITVGDSASAVGVAKVLEPSGSPTPVVKPHLDEVKSQTSGAGPSMTRNERIRQMHRVDIL